MFLLRVVWSIIALLTRATLCLFFTLITLPFILICLFLRLLI